MATINLVTTATNTKYQTVVWSNSGNDDDGAVADVGKYPDKTLQITGTLSGAVPGLQGSMDAQTWFPITSDGTAAIAALGGFYVWENPKFIRFLNVGGDGSTDITYALGMSILV